MSRIPLSVFRQLLLHLFREKSPMILTLIDDNMKSIKQGDLIYISGVKYTVSGILDIGNYGVVADISLEMEV